MAEEENKLQQQEMAMEEEERLKYLEFVQVAAINSVMCILGLYSKAKEKSGALKSGVQTVEGTVKSVVGPVYKKYHDVPAEVLKYVDRKVDESVTKIDRRVPNILKQVSSHAFEVQRTGVVNTASGLAKSVYTKIEPTAKELYSKYEPKAEKCAVSAWCKLNQLPLFPRVAQIVVPTAAYCTEKYNQTVVSTSEKGYRVSSYLPLVPTQKIAKVFTTEQPKYQATSSN